MGELALVINQPDEGKFLQKIGWNKEQIMEVVSAITKQYEGLTYTEEQMAEAKKDRATLNAMRTEISNRKIEVKKALLAPYDAFEAEVKEVVAFIDKPIKMIDEQTSAYEQRLKDEKKERLVEFFKENVGDLEGVLTFDMIFNQKWLNKTASEKFCKDEIRDSIEQAHNDLKVIESTIEEKYRANAKDMYIRNNRDLRKILEEVGRMREVDRKAEEERLAREEAERKAAEKKQKAPTGPEQPTNPQPKPTKQQETAPAVKEEAKSDAVTDPFSDADTDTKTYKASFTIRGTKKQILSVKEFMIENGISFGKVEK